MNKSRTLFCDVLREHIASGDLDVHCTNADIEPIALAQGWTVIPLWFRQDAENPMKVGRGRYDLSSLVGGDSASAMPKSAPVAAAPAPVSDSAPQATAILQQSLVSSESTIPSVDGDFVPWGHFDDVTTIIKSGAFYPTFVTGLSGNGKTTMIMQACAKVNRECYRVNVTSQTDEDDLLGGFRLVNGETVWYDGPVIQAMKNGAVLLLDEIDLGSSPLMCLQPVLEGKGIFLKKINQFVEPAPGFQVFATANTKGKGDDTGAFAHTGILNEAFLDRFPVTLEQPYATEAKEKDILSKKASKFGLDAEAVEGYIQSLVTWAGNIRKSYEVGASSDIITTRRLESILKAFAIFGKEMKAVEMGISRFDEQTKADFLKLFEKISGESATTETQEQETSDVTCPFE